MDATFTPGGGTGKGFDLDVLALALQPDGKIVVGGAFTKSGSTSRNRIARLNSNGTLDTSFDPGTGANSNVQALALQADGSVILVGRFTTFNGAARNYIARLNASGALDAAFSPAPNDLVLAMALQADGRMVIGGTFTTVNGLPAARLARLTAAGALDVAFVPAEIIDATTLKPSVQSLALQADGRIVFGGQFTHVGGVARNRIARLNADGSLDATFDPGSGANATVSALAMQPDGKVLAAGGFTNMVGTMRYYVARLNAGGSLDTTFNPNLALGYTGLLALKTQVDGRMLVGGDIARFDGANPNDLARLATNGLIDASFDAGSGPATSSGTPVVRSIAIQPDGKVIVGGGFTTFNGVKLNYIARLLGDQGGTVEFASASYSVDENDGIASVAVRRTGSAVGSVSINLATSPGTALAGLDYLPQVDPVIFGPGETNKSFSIPILPDSLLEGNETVNLVLGNVIGGAVMGYQQTAVLTIINNTNFVANSAPVLTVPTDQTIDELSTLIITNTASDPDLPANTLTFSLVSAPAGVTLDPSSGVFAWTPSESQGPSTNPITVRVTDNGTPPLSDTRTFTVVVREVNSAPVLTVPADQTINELSTLIVTNTASDPDLPADTLTFSLVSGPAGVTLDPGNGVITWTPSESQGPSTNPITVRVTDNGTPPFSDTKTFVVVVREVNNAPVLTVPADQTINELSTLIVTNTASDPDLPANTLTFSLVSAPAGMTLDPSSGVITWTPSESQGPSTNPITVRVTDNGTPPLSDTKTFTVVVREVNSAPVLTVPADQTINELSTLIVTNTASDPDLPADTLTFSLVSGPAGMTLDPGNGVITWTPSESQGPSTNPITVRVTDNGAPPLSDTRTFTVVVREVNSAPMLTVPADQTINELSTLVVTNIASDPDLPANTLTFSLVSAPAGVTLDPSSGVLAWTPSESYGPSTNPITVRVTDNGTPPLSDTRTFTVVVSHTNNPPVLSPIVNQIACAGVRLVVAASARDIDGPAESLTFTLDAGAPDGAAIDSATGQFTWTPPSDRAPGTNLVTVRVTDAGVPCLSDAKTFAIVLVSPPVIESIVSAEGGVTLTWSAMAGMRYRVQFKSRLDEPTWNDLPVDITATGAVATKTDTTRDMSQRLYRVVLVQ